MDSNKRRLMVIIVVIFIIILSFFAGRYSVHKPYRGADDVNTGMPTSPDHREGIPPDSLHH
jgi:hypothetical protein